MPGKGELTKEKVLKTARRLFYLNGYNNTSIDDILRASRVKKGNLYFHFRSKKELGLAVIDSYLTDEGGAMDRILNGAGSPMERIYRLLDASRKNLEQGGCRGGCPIGNFALEMSDISREFRKRVNRVFDVWTGRLRKVLQEAKKAGEIPRAINTKALAHFVVAVWEGGVMLVKTRRDPRVLGDCIRSLKAMFQTERP